MFCYTTIYPQLTATCEEISSEAAAKLRAKDKAGCLTWDAVDVDAADAIRLCDEGLAMEIEFDQFTMVPDGTAAEGDFADIIVSDCYVPQIVNPTTFGSCTHLEEPKAATPRSVCAILDPCRIRD